MADNNFPALRNNFNYNAIVDAGGRLRVSQLNTLIDIKQTNDNAPLYYDRQNIGGASQAYDTTKGGTIMTVATDGDAAIVQSFMYAPYFAGKSQFIEITFSGFQSEEGVMKRAGYFSTNTTTPFDSDKDGIWFESNESGYYVVVSRFGVELTRKKIRDDAYDFSKFTVFVIEFLYLGGTDVRAGFLINGDIQFECQYRHSGYEENTFLRSPNQPIRYELRSTGGAGTMNQICSQVSSEGSTGEVGISRAIWNQDFQANTSGTFYAALGVRLKSDFLNIRVNKEDITLLSEGNQEFQWFLCINPTVAGTVSWTDLDNSSIQFSRTDATNTVANEAALGTVIESGFGAGNTTSEKSFKNSLRIGSTINGTPDELWLVVQPVSNGLDVWCEITVNEFL